jgi:hypothetical protein
MNPLILIAMPFLVFGMVSLFVNAMAAIDRTDRSHD